MSPTHNTLDSHVQLFFISTQSKPQNRRKRHLAWEKADLLVSGAYSQSLTVIAARYMNLTPTELKVAALVRAMLPSWRIAEVLAISEKTVENHRVKIRKKISCSQSRLNSHLISIK